MAELLPTLNDWCSANAAFSTGEILTEQPLTKCSPNVLRFAKWFKFKATTSSIEIKVKIGNAEGTMKFPYVVLRDESLNELSCLQYNDEQDDIVLNYSELTPGKIYYFSVNNHNHSKYAGTFSLCVTDIESNDFSVGAIKLWSLNDWCSEQGEFSTLAATPDGKASSCIPKGPNFNTWFIFQAVQPEIEIAVKSGGTFGTCKFPVITIWNESLEEVACNNGKADIYDASVKTGGLKTGNIYYISVDHLYNEKYPGSFTLCAKEGNPNKVSKASLISGKLFRKSGPFASVKVVLMNEKGDILSSTTSDAKGKFRFPGLSSDKKYLVKIMAEDNLFEAGIFMVDGKGEILKKTIRDQKIFRFDELPENCHFFSLLDCSKLDVKIDAGKIGVFGKMLSKKDPVDPVVNQMVYLMNSPMKVVDSTVTDQLGKFQFVNFPENQAYLIKLGEPQEENYTEVVMVNSQGNPIMSASSKTIDAKGFFRFERLPAMEPDPIKLQMAKDERMDLSALSEGKNLGDNKIIILDKIYFESGAYKLLEKSFLELNRLAKILSEKPSIKLEISGHTDNTGNETINLHLSENRAKAVVDYLVSKGIDISRLSYSGKGSSSPISPNNSEENKQKNRRVEFKVVY